MTTKVIIRLGLPLDESDCRTTMNEPHFIVSFDGRKRAAALADHLDRYEGLEGSVQMINYSSHSNSCSIDIASPCSDMIDAAICTNVIKRAVEDYAKQNCWSVDVVVKYGTPVSNI